MDQALALKFGIRAMRLGDIPQVLEIDREAFPTQWPPPSYAQELRKRLAYYVVAWEQREGQKGLAPDPDLENPGQEKAPLPKGRLQQWLYRARHLFDRDRFFGPEEPPTTSQNIVGYAGFWVVFDESHITSIATHRDYRRRGIGELLLVSVIEMSRELNMKVVTLEVRASNTGAQCLYQKYGFKQVGLRSKYYTDDGEDALLMTTEPITSPDYHERFLKLKTSLEQRLNGS